MNKTELIKTMRKFAPYEGYFINLNELSQYLGYKHPQNMAWYVHGLDKIGRRYFIPDVAESLLEKRKV